MQTFSVTGAASVNRLKKADKWDWDALPLGSVFTKLILISQISLRGKSLHFIFFCLSIKEGLIRFRGKKTFFGQEMFMSLLIRH